MGKIVLELDVMMARRHMSLNDLADQVGITNATDCDSVALFFSLFDCE